MGSWLAILMAVNGCAHINTGPFLLGEIPTGLPDFGVLTQGSVYKDPRQRFNVVIPASGLKAKRMPYGVLLFNAEPPTGIMSYVVFAYDRPAGVPAGEPALEATADGIQAMFQKKKFPVHVLRKEAATDRGRPAMDLDFYVDDTRPGNMNAKRLYVGRLVDAGPYVYWMYYSSAVFQQNHVDEGDRRLAERFFSNVAWP